MIVSLCQVSYPGSTSNPELSQLNQDFHPGGRDNIVWCVLFPNFNLLTVGSRCRAWPLYVLDTMIYQHQQSSCLATMYMLLAIRATTVAMLLLVSSM